MKRFICLILTIVGIVGVVSGPAGASASTTAGSVTGIGTGSFPAGAVLAGVVLDRFEIATGVITEEDSSAGGVFHAVLAGRTILGSARNITIEGNVTQGSVTTDSVSFSGLATLDLGDGVPAVSGVPFNVSTENGSIVLTVQSAVLPSAAFRQGGLDTGP